MTPATYGRGGAGARLRWLTTTSEVGRILVAATDRGVCFVAVGDDDAALVRSLEREFPRAEVAPAPSPELAPLAAAASAASAGMQPTAAWREIPDVYGTAFQWRVWRALTKIPAGETRSYAQVARAIGRPGSARAVARACATNPLALLVPCHRVVPSSGGSTGGYRWGAKVKEQILARERTGRT
jgi:AraC family transcriptional regulator of adaptative response/methylated-DNA-[protein]-cysteine methyltransferase